MSALKEFLKLWVSKKRRTQVVSEALKDQPPKFVKMVTSRFNFAVGLAYIMLTSVVLVIIFDILDLEVMIEYANLIAQLEALVCIICMFPVVAGFMRMEINRIKAQHKQK